MLKHMSMLGIWVLDDKKKKKKIVAECGSPFPTEGTGISKLN